MTPLLHLTGGPWIPRVPAGHSLLIFKCEGPGICNFWEPDSIANRCLMVTRSALDGAPRLPRDVETEQTTILPRLWVKEWIPSEDGITPAQAEAINSPDRYWDLPDELHEFHEFDSKRFTKAGGAPYWTGNGPSPQPEGERQLLFQIDSWIHVAGSADDISGYCAQYGPYAHVSGNQISAANFMSDGTAYVFDTTPNEPIPTPGLVINR